MLNKTTLTAAIALNLSATAAQATVFNMTYMNFPGNNNTTVSGTVDSAMGTGTFNSGGTPFFIAEWTVTVTGTYSSTDGAQGASGINSTSWTSSVGGTGASATTTYNFTLAPGQVAMSLLYDWSGVLSTPVLNIINADGSGVDIDGDGTFGTLHQVGPTVGFPMGFRGPPVPIPAAAWLMGSGLIGLAGVARRRKAN